MERDPQFPILSLLAPKASEASKGASYFRQRAIVDWNYGLCGDCYAIGVQHRGDSSGCKLPTLFGSDCDDGVSAV